HWRPRPGGGVPAAAMCGAMAAAGCVPLARVPVGKHEYIKMVLDSGAMGIVAPMVMSAEEARTIVAATKYPPRGNRSVGGGMHALNLGAAADQYFLRAHAAAPPARPTADIPGHAHRDRS